MSFVRAFSEKLSLRRSTRFRVCCEGRHVGEGVRCPTLHLQTPCRVAARLRKALSVCGRNRRRPGVLHAARILKEEVERDMALIGVNRLAEMTPDLLRRMPTSA